MQSTTLKIFLSYSWANKNIADSIDEDFKVIGISFTRDVRDVNFKDSLKRFMQKVRVTDFVVMLISDEFLKSINCMYEMLELFKETKFKKRLLPVIIEGADVFTPKGRLNYIQYWEEEYNSLKRKAKDSELENLSKISEDLKHLKNICSTIGEFMSVISSELSVPFSKLKANNYKEILDYIGLNENTLVSKVFKINEVKDLEQKDYLLDKFILENPDFFLGYFMKAFNETNKDKKVLFYTKVIEVIDGNAEAYNNRGNVYKEIGKYEESERDYTKAIELNPEFTEAYKNRGLLYFEQGRNEASERDFTKAIELNPAYADGFICRGVLYNKVGRNEESEHDFLMAIGLNPESVGAYNNRGIVYYKTGRNIEAEKDYTKAIELNPDNALAYQNRGVLYQSLGRNIEAERDFQKYRELNEK